MPEFTATLPIMFRAERSGDSKGDVTAVFPNMADDYAGRYFTVYAHVGQHGGGSLDWYRSTRPARPDEYADLLAELRSIYETRPAAFPETYGEPVKLKLYQRMTAAHCRELGAAAARARAQLREDPRGAPWIPQSAAVKFMQRAPQQESPHV